MAEGYVNRGPDPRVDGTIGKIAGGIQRKLSFQSPEPPKTTTLGPVQLSWPPHVSIFVPRGGGHYWSLRFGWRWDPNWGDGNNPNEPQIEKPGGYIADVVYKSDIDNKVTY